LWTNPANIPYDKTGYFWAWNAKTKERISLGRLIWEFYNQREIPEGLFIDHGNDWHNLNTRANISAMTTTQNINKLRYSKRFSGPYSVTFISHPKGLPVKLLRFMDTDKGTQDLLLYHTNNGLDDILKDLNSFKIALGKGTAAFKYCFNELVKHGKYDAHIKQSIIGDEFTREIFSISINWLGVDKAIGSIFSMAV
jgi:hypothetical protein